MDEACGYIDFPYAAIDSYLIGTVVTWVGAEAITVLFEIIELLSDASYLFCIEVC